MDSTTPPTPDSRFDEPVQRERQRGGTGAGLVGRLREHCLRASGSAPQALDPLALGDGKSPAGFNAEDPYAAC